MRRQDGSRRGSKTLFGSVWRRRVVEEVHVPRIVEIFSTW
jgi:hypothetical protein